MREIIGFFVVAGLVVACIAGAGPNAAQRVLEATVQMERVAKALEHTKALSPETRQEIVRLMNQPWSDCDQLACRTSLGIRNRVARVRLQSVLAVAEAADRRAGRIGDLARAAH